MRDVPAEGRAERACVSVGDFRPAGQVARRSVLDTGYLLCGRSTQIVWDRVSVFAGSFSEPAAVFICGGKDGPGQVSSALIQLAAVGVLEQVDDPGGVRRPRYRMTRAARESGIERLKRAGEFRAAAERHLALCRHRAEVAGDLWNAGRQQQAVQLVNDGRDELAAMVRYALAQPQHIRAALQCVVDVWFWWAVHGNAAQGHDHLKRLLPRYEPDSALTVRGLWLAAWLTPSNHPQTARTLLDRAWQAAVLAGDDATIGRIAHVEGIVALHLNEARAAAEHFREAAERIPLDAPGGPSSAAYAALAVAQAAFAPHDARHSARRALTHPGTRHDAWAALQARYAHALAEHSRGHSARAWNKTHRALAGQLPGVPAPDIYQALRHLIADISTGIPGRRDPCGAPAYHRLAVPSRHRGRRPGPASGPQSSHAHPAAPNDGAVR